MRPLASIPSNSTAEDSARVIHTVTGSTASKPGRDGAGGARVGMAVVRHAPMGVELNPQCGLVENPPPKLPLANPWGSHLQSAGTYLSCISRARESHVIDHEAARVLVHDQPSLAVSSP